MENCRISWRTDDNMKWTQWNDWLKIQMFQMLNNDYFYELYSPWNKSALIINNKSLL